MPEDKEDKTVDIDTSGPDVQIELPEEKQEQENVIIEESTEKEIDKTYENERETKLEDGGIANDTSERSDEQPVIQEDNKQQS